MKSALEATLQTSSSESMCVVAGVWGAPGLVDLSSAAGRSSSPKGSFWAFFGRDREVLPEDREDVSVGAGVASWARAEVVEWAAVAKNRGSLWP